MNNTENNIFIQNDLHCKQEWLPHSDEKIYRCEQESPVIKWPILLVKGSLQRVQVWLKGLVGRLLQNAPDRPVWWIQVGGQKSRSQKSANLFCRTFFPVWQMTIGNNNV